MQKITLLCVLAILCLKYGGYAQTYNAPEGKLYIDSRLPNLDLGAIINYKDSTAFLSDFKNKIIILDFWFTECGACIAQFPKEDSLQKQFNDDIQIIPVTFESQKKVTAFLSRWTKKNHSTLALPFIVGDSVLNIFFANTYFPHYIWISQDRRIIAHTSEYFLTAENIEAMLRETASIKVAIEKDHGIPERGMDIKDLYNFYLNQKHAK
jgi:thiol-disulfide isomerase/thioredoxin